LILPTWLLRSPAPWAVAFLGTILVRPVAAQSLYMPRDIKRAIARGTRTLDGEPGEAYWQNHAHYTMTVTVMPPDRRVTGTEHITYLNASPDTLESLVIRLFQNYHQPGAPRLNGTTAAFLTSGEHIDGFAINGQPQPWETSPRSFTWQSVTLATPLLPHDSVQLDFTWHYEVSEQASREGMIDSTTYFLAYFYPRVAVFDDLDGWDRMEHVGHEFYSDFNDYNVSIQVPPGFVVWGTGTLSNASSVLQPQPLRRFEASLSSDTTIHVATKGGLAAGAVTAEHPLNVWRFTARDVPDMAFGLSDHYDWDAASLVVDDATHRRASVQAAYNDTATDFHAMVQIGRHALDWLSHEWPGIPYPYEKTTEFQGGAGMEYPMMANDASYQDTAFARLVAEHELAHTYMPFYMGIDETRYAFMDEGWATTLEYLIGVSDVGRASADSQFKRFRVDEWSLNPSPTSDLPIITPADALTGSSYGANAYGKAALGYLAMKDLLGDTTFRACLHAYMARWHGRHPSPWDFFNTFDDVAKRPLDWFWRNWFFTNGYIDLAVRSVHKASGGYQITIENVGGMDAPVDLVLHYVDGGTQTVHETAGIWARDPRNATVTVPTTRAVRSVALDTGIWVDADASNNTWTAP
jgi:hypothetical protein